MRIVIVDMDTCQSNECIKLCPGVRMDDETVVFDDPLGKPVISEELQRVAIAATILHEMDIYSFR